MATKETKSVFATLNAINVNEHVEKKKTGGVELTYLSWVWAWAKVKENYPDATYTIYENADGWNYHTDGRTCWVKTGVLTGWSTSNTSPLWTTVTSPSLPIM